MYKNSEWEPPGLTIKNPRGGDFGFHFSILKNFYSFELPQFLKDFHIVFIAYKPFGYEVLAWFCYDLT